MSSLVGRPCPEFAAEDVQQREFRPSDYRGQWLLLVFHRHLA